MRKADVVRCAARQRQILAKRIVSGNCYINMENEVLQTFSFYEYTDIEISFSIKTKQLDLPSLSEFLKLNPTRGWSKDQRYIGKQLNLETKQIETIERSKPWTMYAYETKGLVESTRFNEHAEHLIEKLTLIENNLRTLIDQPDYFEINIIIYLILDESEKYFGFSTDPQLLQKLTQFCHHIEWRNQPSNIH